MLNDTSPLINDKLSLITIGSTFEISTFATEPSMRGFNMSRRDVPGNSIICPVSSDFSSISLIKFDNNNSVILHLF